MKRFCVLGAMLTMVMRTQAYEQSTFTVPERCLKVVAAICKALYNDMGVCARAGGRVNGVCECARALLQVLHISAPQKVSFIFHALCVHARACVSLE